MAAAIVEGIVQETGTFLAELAGAPRAWLVSPGDLAGDLSTGDLEEVHFLNSSSSTAACKVLAIDTISRPNRAKVELLDDGKVIVVPVLDEPEAERWSSCAQKNGGTAHEEAMVVGTNTTIYQDYDDAFDLAEDRLATFEAVRCAASAAPQAKERSSKLFQDLRKSLTQEFQYLGEDLCNLAVGAANVAAVGSRVLFPAVKTS